MGDGHDQLFFSPSNHRFSQGNATLFYHVYDGCLELEVFLDGAHKNFHRHFLIKRGTDDFEEAFQLFLLILGSLRSCKVVTHSELGVQRHLHFFHGSVSYIELLLEFLRFPADLGE